MAAHVIKSLDLLIHAANGLNVAVLIHRSRDGELLPDGKIRERGKQRVNFSGAGAIAIHAGIGLLEANAGGKRKRLILRELLPQISRNNLHALVVESPAQIGFALHVDEANFSECDRRCDAAGFAKSVAADFEHAQAVHLADALAGGVNENQILVNHLLDFCFGQVVAIDFGVERFAHVIRRDHFLPFVACHVGRFAREVRKIEKSRRNFAAPACMAHALLQDGGDGCAVKREKFFVVA